MSHYYYYEKFLPNPICLFFIYVNIMSIVIKFHCFFYSRKEGNNVIGNKKKKNRGVNIIIVTVPENSFSMFSLERNKHLLIFVDSMLNKRDLVQFTIW